MEKAFKLLQKENAELKAENAVLKKTVQQLTARLEELERRFKLDSQTSHKPSGAEPFRKPIVTRTQSNKPSGGQKGHPGKTLEMTNTPDMVKTIEVNLCEACQADLSKTKSQRKKRGQVFDILPARPGIKEPAKMATHKNRFIKINKQRISLTLYKKIL